MRPLLILFFSTVVLAGCNGGSLETYDPGMDQGTVPGPDAAGALDASTSSPDVRPSTPDADPAGENDATRSPDMQVEPPRQFVITGESDGTLRAFSFDHETAAITESDVDTSASRITFAAFHPDLDIVYTTSDATVRAYDFAAETGSLTFRSAASSADNGTHLEVDHTGAYVFTVSYGGHSLSMLPLDGGDPRDSAIDLGGGADPSFCQNAHQVRVHPNNEFVYVPCLGSDFVRILSFDADAGTLESIGTAAVPAGAGPRHMDFHPTMPRAYVLNETASSITIFAVDATTGMLTSIDTVTTLPSGVTAGSASSDIHVSPDGQHLYAVNRQPRHEIVTFAVDGDTLTALDHLGGNGEHARSFAIDATGRYLLMANRNSNNVNILSRTASDGRLNYDGDITGSFSGGPMFVGFLAR